MTFSQEWRGPLGMTRLPRWCLVVSSGLTMMRNGTGVGFSFHSLLPLKILWVPLRQLTSLEGLTIM